MFPALLAVMAAAIPCGGGDTPSPYDRTSAYYFEKGRLQFQNEMYDFSIESLQRALEMDGTRYEAANMLAAIYGKRNAREKGIYYYRISLKINPGQPEIHFALGELYDFFSETDLAFRHFSEAVKINPNHLKGNLSLVRYYIARKDPAAADRHFRAGYAAGETLTREKYREARRLYRERRYDRAVRLLNECLEINPALLEAYTDLFDIYRSTGHPVRAIEVMERLKFLKPDHEKAYTNLGQLYFTQKLPGKRKTQIERSISNYRKALEINPGNYETYYYLSHVYYEIGDHEQGRELELMAERLEKERDTLQRK